MLEAVASYHRMNIFLWGAILGAIIILTLAVFILNTNDVLQPATDVGTTTQILFILAVCAAIAILLLKRSVFSAERIVRNARKQAGSDQEKLIFNTLRRNWIIIWTLAELIAILGFFHYVLTTQINNYLIFVVVSVYSLLINMPKEGFVIRCLELLQE